MKKQSDAGAQALAVMQEAKASRSQLRRKENKMNELLIAGIVAFAFDLMCIVATIADSF